MNLDEKKALDFENIRKARIERLFLVLWVTAMAGFLGWLVLYAWWERIGPF